MAESQFSDNRGHIPSDSEPRNQQNGLSSSSHNSPTITHTRSQLVPWQVGKLWPHPSYARLGIEVPASRLNALLEMGEDAFLFPLIVTSDGIVIDGYARLEVARLQGRTIVECVEYDISEEEALRRLLLCHRPSPGLVPFSRIVMARDLAKSLREKALKHQQAGGKSKGSSKLTEAEKVEVRKEIAGAAGVSVGTLSHALEVFKTGDPEILRALCNGEIKIDRAWRWSKESRSHQRESLKRYRRHRGMERVAEKLVASQVKKLKSKRRSASRWKNATLSETVSRLGPLAPGEFGVVNVIFIKASVPILALSEDIGQRLGFREEALPCP
jgi:transcriptional regulator with XRE-family HTH domain